MKKEQRKQLRILRHNTNRTNRAYKKFAFERNAPTCVLPQYPLLPDAPMEFEVLPPEEKKKLTPAGLLLKMLSMLDLLFI